MTTTSGQEERRPNVRLAHNKQPITVNGPVNIGTVTVDLPSEAEQRKGFWVSNPTALCNQYPHLYRRLVGTTRSVVVTQPVQTQTTVDDQRDPVDRLVDDAESDVEFKQEGGQTQDGSKTQQ